MIFILIIFFSLSSYSYDSLDPNINYQEKCYYGCKSEKVSRIDLLSRQCAIDLCGSPSSPKSMNYTDKTFVNYIDQRKLKDFDSSISAIKKIANIIFEQNNTLIKKFEKILEDENGVAKEFRLLDDNQQLQLINFLFKDYIKYESSIENDKIIKLKVKTSSNMSGLISSGIKSYASYKEEKLNNEDKLMYYDFLYNDSEYTKYSRKKTEIIQNRLNILVKKISQFCKETGKDLSIFFDFSENGNYPNSALEYFKYLKAGKLYTYSERADDLVVKLKSSFSKQLKISMQNKEVEKDFFDRIKYNKPKVPTNTLLAVLYSLENMDLKSIIKRLKEENNKLKTEKVKEKISYCKSIYALSLIKDISKSEKSELLKDLAKNITTLGIEFLSSKSQKKLKKDILPVIKNRFIITKDRERYKVLSTILKSNHAELINSHNPDSSFLKLLYLGKTTEIDPLLILEDICSLGTKINSSTFISAAHDPGDGKIQLSELMLKNKYAFQSIASHELGHLISTQFNQKNDELSKVSLEIVDKKKSCLAKSNYSEKILKSSRYFRKDRNDKNISIYSEEDFADYIAMKSTRYSPKNGLCYILTPSVDGKNYINLNINLDGDDHAPALIRVIREAVSKYVNLSKSCEQLMNLIKENFRFDPC